MRKWTWISAIVAMMGFSTLGYADLLVNEGFADPDDCSPPSGSDACVQNICAPTTVAGGVGGWTVEGTLGFNRNNSLLGQVEQICDAVGGTPLPDQDGFYATLENGNRAGGLVYQSATVTAGEFYRVGFKWSNLWSNGNVGMRFRVEARDGTSPNAGTVLAGKEEILQGNGHDFLEDSFVFQATSGSAVIVWRVAPTGPAPSCCDFLLSHMDYITLEVAPCANPPTLADPPATPSNLIREATTPVTITGTNFTLGVGETLSVRLEQGATVIAADTATVDNDGQISATFTPAATDPPGQYTLVVERQGLGCDPASATNAVTVILPALSNGDFQNPDNSPVDCAAELGVPTDWQGREDRWGFTNRASRNGFVSIGGIDQTLAVRPTCPPPNGSTYYGTMATGSDDSASALMWQTVAVNDDSTYTLTGQFASSATAGGLNATIQIRDGNQNGTVLAETQIRDFAESGLNDWAFNFVEAAIPPGTNVVTVALNVASSEVAGQKALHADGLLLGECLAPITVSGVTPAQALNNGTVSITNLAGTGFAGTPTVLLSKPGATIEATNVQVVSGTQISCDIDLTGVSSGRYDVIVVQDNCVASLTGASGFLVIGEALQNGSFELPDPSQTPCTGRIGGPIAGWSSETVTGDGVLARDSQAPPPGVCPNPTDGGHYGSLSGAVTTVRTWQTLATIPGVSYRFAGEFSGGPGGVIANLNIRQGDESAAISDTVDVFSGGGSSGAGLPWIPGEIVATATGSYVTVEIEMISSQVTGGGLNMDGVTFVPTFECNDPRADSDGDGDVDQTDFKVFQLCLSEVPFDPDATFNGYACGCMDLDGSASITSSDFVIFAGCAAGPTVPADPACDD